ncbi:hypothetical protein BC826DRAFT_1025032, partial [Russula brevipes]
MWEWHTLIHVCRRWRYLIFALQRHLDLRLVLHRPGKQCGRILDLLPALPISICYDLDSVHVQDEDNIVAALKYSDRISQIQFCISSSVLEKSAAWEEDSFSELEYLQLTSAFDIQTVLPRTFLGRSTGRLRYIELRNILFPGFPRLLLSSRDLISLSLGPFFVVDTGFPSPGLLSATLSSVPRLQCLSLQPDPEMPPTEPPPHDLIVLSALIHFHLDGSRGYLEDLVSRIDAPILETLDVSLEHGYVFDIPQLSQFIHRTRWMSSLPKLTAVRSSVYSFTIEHHFRKPSPSEDETWLKLHCPTTAHSRQGPRSPMLYICRQLSPLMSSVEELVAGVQFSRDSANLASFLQFLARLGCVQHFTLYGPLAQGAMIGILYALEQQSTGEAAQELLLPALRFLHVPDFRKEHSSVKSLLAARQLA